MGHRLVDGYPDKCKFLHGHNYVLEVTVGSEEGSLNQHGMVIDFSHLKQIVKNRVINKLDHAFMVCVRDTVMVAWLEKYEQKRIVVHFNTTVENMLGYMERWIRDGLGAVGPRLLGLKLWETETSYAEWRDK